MANTHTSHNVVVVTGDVTMDWNLARTRRDDEGRLAWTGEDCTCAYWQRGGAALLADLIDAVASELQQGGQAPATKSARWARRRSRSIQAIDAIITLTPCGPSCTYGANRLSIERNPPGASMSSWDWTFAARPMERQARIGTGWWTTARKPASSCSTMRTWAFASIRNSGPAPSRRSRRPWILLKMARPVAQGELWEHLHQSAPNG